MTKILGYLICSALAYFMASIVTYHFVITLLQVLVQASSIFEIQVFPLFLPFNFLGFFLVFAWKIREEHATQYISLIVIPCLLITGFFWLLSLMLLWYPPMKVLTANLAPLDYVKRAATCVFLPLIIKMLKRLLGSLISSIV